MNSDEPAIEPMVRPIANTRFVLIEPSHPGNVGAVARAMKVMGFSDLVLVSPRLPGVTQSTQAMAMASGAVDVLQGAQVVSCLAEALVGVTLACATAMTPRDFGPPTYTPRTYFESLAKTDHRLALVFGCERYGMNNDDVYRCHATLTIPTDPSFGSLNLAQAVQLIAYEWRQACGSFSVPNRPVVPPWADAAAVSGLLQHWQDVLIEINFLQPQAPGKLMARLQQLLNRAHLTREEVHILRGIARHIGAAGQRPGTD